MSGFVSVGLNRPKNEANVGGVLRAAHIFGASSVIIAQERVRKIVRSPLNTTKAERSIPVIRCDELRDCIPFGAVPVAVDLVEGAVDLCSFAHPKRAFYIFGPEDGTLGQSILSWCPYRVMIPSAYCLNLCACVNVVLYDRMAKERRASDGFGHQAGDRLHRRALQTAEG